MHAIWSFDITTFDYDESKLSTYYHIAGEDIDRISQFVFVDDKKRALVSTYILHPCYYDYMHSPYTTIHNIR